MDAHGKFITPGLWDMHVHFGGGDTLIQEYVSGCEFGVFYYRMPDDARGRIFSITEKRFPEVVADGVHSVRELIAMDERASCLAGVYCSRLRRSVQDVPASGERVPLTEVGSHCKGGCFWMDVRYGLRSWMRRWSG